MIVKIEDINEKRVIARTFLEALTKWLIVKRLKQTE